MTPAHFADIVEYRSKFLLFYSLPPDVANVDPFPFLAGTDFFCDISNNKIRNVQDRIENRIFAGKKL